MNIKIVKVIDAYDFDKLVKETYGRPYHFQQQDGCKERQRVSIEIPSSIEDYTRDTIPEIVNGSEMGVSFQAWIDRDPELCLDRDEGRQDDNSNWRLNLWWERNFYPEVGMILNDLHSKGLMDVGKYEIDIDW